MRNKPDGAGIAERIRHRRKELGLNQKDLAALLGITQGAVAQMETGARSPSLDLVPRLAKALRVTTDYLFIGEDSALLEVGGLSGPDKLLLRRFRDFLVSLNKERRV
jgi:transcriptional regulator with XRE-family HTH domain